ncbi:hypothetical protein [Staphylococcus hominis]
MFNQTLVNLMKDSVRNGQQAVCCNNEDFKDLDKMIKKGYILDYQDTEILNEYGETEVIFYPTEKFNNL